MKNMTKEWLKAAREDLLLVKKIEDDQELSHIAAFHSEQAVEKALKAVFEEKGIEIPKIHKLQTLFAILNEDVFKKMDNEIVKLLDSLYTEARYPGEMGLLPNGKPSTDDVRQFLTYAKDIYQKAESLIEIIYKIDNISKSQE